MTLLPEIIREAKIVSGKDQPSFMKKSTKHSKDSADDALVSSSTFSVTANETTDLKASKTANEKDNKTDFDSTNLNNASTNSFTTAPVKKRLSRSHHRTTVAETLMHNPKPSSTEAGGEKPPLFPSLILNDKNRSTAYQRPPKSSDFANVKNSPIATRLIYNWKAVDRQNTKTVQAKVKIYKPQKRIEMPARPSSPYRVKVSWETVEPHFHNEKRTLEMKRLQYLREHTEWSIYPYAAIDEREQYNKRLRETLKEQIEQKDRSTKEDFERRSLESKFVKEQDDTWRSEDLKKRNDKFKFLQQYRDENKQLMEERWMHSYLSKRYEWQQESELLKQDPINWSKTLR